MLVLLFALGWLVTRKGSVLASPTTVQLRGAAVTLELEAIGSGYALRRDAAAAFLLMQSAAAAEGLSLKVNSAWRSNEEQAALYALFLSGKGNLAAPVGWSNHEAGTAVDVESDSGRNAEFFWLTKNAARFGFYRTVPSEPWHWEFR